MTIGMEERLSMCTDAIVERMCEENLSRRHETITCGAMTLYEYRIFSIRFKTIFTMR